MTHVARFVPLFKLLRLCERLSAYAQGKGYGSATIQQENRLVQALLGRTPQLAVDIGGNIGDYTAELRRRHPHLEIHLFEPAHSNIVKLQKRFAHDANVFINAQAVSNAAGTATLFSNAPGSGLGSLTRRKLDHFKIDFDVKETVSTLRFEDYWAKTLQRRPIDIVKIDVEGHEGAVLEGFGEAIRAVKVIQFEFGGCNIDTRTYFQDFWYFFEERDFALYRITPFGVEPIEHYRESDEVFSTTNYIAVNRSLR